MNQKQKGYKKNAVEKPGRPVLLFQHPVPGGSSCFAFSNADAGGQHYQQWDDEQYSKQNNQLDKLRLILLLFVPAVFIYQLFPIEVYSG